MKKLSHKDLIIVLGVLVAVVILVSSVYFNEGKSEVKSVKVAPEKKIKPAAILQKVVQKFSSHVSI